MRIEIPYFRQEQRYSCGIACLRMILRYWGERFTEMEIIAVADISPLLGMTPKAIVEAWRFKKRRT